MKPRQRPSGRLVSSENREDLNKHSLAVCCFSWKACIETNIALADFKDKSRHFCKKHQSVSNKIKIYQNKNVTRNFTTSVAHARSFCHQKPPRYLFSRAPPPILKGKDVQCTLTLCTTSIYLCDLALLVGNLWVVFDGHCIGRPVFVYKSRISLYAPTIASTGHTIFW